MAPTTQNGSAPDAAVSGGGRRVLGHVLLAGKEAQQVAAGEHAEVSIDLRGVLIALGGFPPA